MHSSPNAMVWTHVRVLERAVERAHRAPDARDARDEVVVAILFAVAAVEAFVDAFFNLEFRQSAKPPWSEKQWEQQRRKDLPHRLNIWPEKFFGVKLSGSHDNGFSQLLKERNRLVHFTNSHETLDISPDLMIVGLTNTGRYDNLLPDHAAHCLEVCLTEIRRVHSASGRTGESLEGAFHSWTGIPPRTPIPPRSR